MTNHSAAKIGTRTYLTRSVCPCGFTVLKDEVPLGKQYEVLEGSEGVGAYFCGGCRTGRPVTMILVRDSTGGFFPLPTGIFDVTGEAHG